MGKFTNLGSVKLGERGQFGGGIITGGNLRRPTEMKSAEPVVETPSSTTGDKSTYLDRDGLTISTRRSARPKPTVKPPITRKPKED